MHTALIHCSGKRVLAYGPSRPLVSLPASKAPVQPLCVFAARRDSFDVIVRCPYAENALPMIFAHLPMDEHGWRFDETNIERVGTRDGFPIWRINRS